MARLVLKRCSVGQSSLFHRMDAPMQNHGLLSYFSIIQDYRQTGKIEHKLTDILLLVMCAVIAGADGWEGTENFGHNRLLWLQEYADLDKSTTSQETLARVTSLIN